MYVSRGMLQADDCAPWAVLTSVLRGHVVSAFVVAGSVGVRQSAVREAVVSASAEAQDVRPPGRISGERHGVSVIRGDDDQRVAAHHGVGHLDRFGELYRLVQSFVRQVVVVSLVDSATCVCNECIMVYNIFCF